MIKGKYEISFSEFNFLLKSDKHLAYDFSIIIFSIKAYFESFPNKQMAKVNMRFVKVTYNRIKLLGVKVVLDQI